jgi:hypothetical protein
VDWIGYYTTTELKERESLSISLSNKTLVSTHHRRKFVPLFPSQEASSHSLSSDTDHHDDATDDDDDDDVGKKEIARCDDSLPVFLFQS